MLTLVLVAVGAATDRNLVTSPGDRPGPSWLWVLMAVLVPLLIIRRLIRQRAVSTGTLLGAVCVYLSIVVAFFFLILTVDAYVGRRCSAGRSRRRRSCTSGCCRPARR